MLTIIHAGQTGVERGAHQGAVSAGLPVAGVMSSDGRDELGPVPEDIARMLQRNADRGYRPALVANIEACSAALVVVPRIEELNDNTVIPWVCRLLRRRSAPFLACDPDTNASDVVAWVQELGGERARRLLVTGPRGTRWQAGEGVTRRLIIGVAAELGE